MFDRSKLRKIEDYKSSRILSVSMSRGIFKCVKNTAEKISLP